MTIFVLVHGGTFGGWCWTRVASRLRAAGHEVFAPTLTGLGERAHLVSPAIDLEMHIADVLGVLVSEELSDVVLCGHSYGGMVVTGVADQAPDTIRALVYVDALIPDDGQSAFDLMDPAVVARMPPGPYLEPMPSAYWKVAGDDAAWIERRTTRHPKRCFEQKIHLTGAFKRIPKRMLIPAGVDTVYARRAEALAREDAAWQLRPLPGTHNLMITHPDGLTALLLAAG